MYQDFLKVCCRIQRLLASLMLATVMAMIFTFAVATGAWAQTTVVDSYDDGLPMGMFSFDGNTNTVAVTTTVIAVVDPLAAPNQSGQNGVVKVDYNIADFGGVTNGFEVQQNWSSKTGLSFWFRGTNSGERYQIEIFDNRSDPAVDTAERFEYRFTDTVEGWRNFTIPFSSFERSTDYQPVGAPNDGLNLTSVWGYSIVLPQAADTVYLDAMALTDDFLLADYETGDLAVSFTFNDDATTIDTEIVSINSTSPLAMAGQTGANSALKLAIDIQEYGGVGRAFAPDPLDWSAYDGIGFWFYGSNSGGRFQFELHDNRTDPDSESERYEYRFNDDFRGWQEFRVPFSSFVRSTDFQPANVPDDGLTLSEIWGYDIVLPQVNATVLMDTVALLADVPDAIDDNPGTVSDFDSGLPAGYYDYNGTSSTLAVTTTLVMVGDALALPNQRSDMSVLSVEYAIEDYGGFAIASSTEPQDWRGHTGVGFWFYGSNSGGTFQVEVFDNRSDLATDTSERFEYRFADDFSGWRKMHIPFDDFVRATDFQPTGAPDDGFNLNEIWGYSFIMPAATGQVYISELSIVDEAPVETFDGATIPSGYYQFSDDASTTTGQPAVTTVGGPNERPFQRQTNGVLAIDYNIPSLEAPTYGGVAVKYPNASQDWSLYDGVSFWLRGNNAGDRIQFELFDNRSDPAADDAERYEYRLIDHGPSWRLVRIRFTDFVRAVDFQPATAPNDGLNLTEIWGFELGLPRSSGTLLLDELSVFTGSGELGFVVTEEVYLPFVQR